MRSAVKIPMILPSDRAAFQAAVLTCNAVGRPPRIVRIENTLRLNSFWVSESLLPDAESDPALTVVAPAVPVRFDAHDNLPDLPPVEE